MHILLSCTHHQQVEQAQATSSKIEAELKDLKSTLKNIEDARPFDQLTVDDVVAARPEIGRTVDEMVKKGKWTTPGYDEKFGSECSFLLHPRGLCGSSHLRSHFTLRNQRVDGFSLLTFVLCSYPCFAIHRPFGYLSSRCESLSVIRSTTLCRFHLEDTRSCNHNETRKHNVGCVAVDALASDSGGGC